MEADLLRSGLTAFLTLLVVVDPFGIVPIFVALTLSASPRQRRAILTRAIATALGVALFFLVAGRGLLNYLGVTVHAFAIAGGGLLFIAALPMLFGQRPGLQAPEAGEGPGLAGDVAVFPLAIPLLSGPGAVTTIVLLRDRVTTGPPGFAILAMAVVAVFLVSWLVLYFGGGLLARLGESGLHVATRVLGVVLAALAVQYVLDGIAEYYRAIAGS